MLLMYNDPSKGGVISTHSRLAVTGGRHKMLPPKIGNCEVVSVNEVNAIGRGGRALAGLTSNRPGQCW